MDNILTVADLRKAFKGVAGTKSVRIKIPQNNGWVIANIIDVEYDKGLNTYTININKL